MSDATFSCCRCPTLGADPCNCPCHPLRKEMEDMAIDHDKDLRILLGVLEKAKEALEEVWEQFAVPARPGIGYKGRYPGGLSALETCESALARINSLLHPK